jgi:hypothetical protein
MRQSNTHMAIVVTNTVYMDKRKNLEATMDRGLTVAWILAQVDASRCLFPLLNQHHVQGIARPRLALRRVHQARNFYLGAMAM